jgi:glycosyltransferase involved in cell wall biosynthesis
MKLLITTQKVDRADPVLGFFHRWIEEFAKHCEQVTVICLEVGEYSFPNNVTVHSLGKERGKRSPFSYAVGFLSLSIRLRNQYDSVFVHMNPEYVILGGLFWKLWGKKVGLWYVHRAVNTRLRVAVSLIDYVFTASKESFRLATPRVRVMGHGIDTAFFSSPTRPVSETLSIMSVGRLSPSKRVEVVLVALGLLRERGVPFTAKIVGAPARSEDEQYAWELRTSASVGSDVLFTGALPHAQMPALLAQSQYFLSASTTGSLDKAVLEAMSAGVVPITSNEAFRDMLSPLGLFSEEGTPEEFAEILSGFAKEPGRAIMLSQALSKMVRDHHSLEKLIPGIVRTYTVQ